MKATFDHRQHETDNIYTFWFKPKEPIKYIAGQFTEIKLPHPKTDDRGDKRWFTLSSSPTDKLLSITTKFAEEKSSSFKKTLFALKPGTELNLADPMGDFVLPKDKSRPLLFVAGGMGITPYHSIIKWLKDNNEKRHIQLIYAVSKPEYRVFDSLFEDYSLKYTPILGSLDLEMILKIAKEDAEKLVYISGPEPLIEDLVKGIEKAGVPKHQLVTDYFPGYKTV
ncbi:MAG TPA: FAD-dependent oxidoreductase [Patescibacteria group bacterium]|nr:FAD-dependent oxidoreductase [Patescibacteria group bacterium]